MVEERQDGVHAYKQKIRTKVYGLNSTKAVRQSLIELLLERVEHHKDKIISPIIYNELLGMEVKRNGKVEHSASTHDDQVFSMLMALWVWYEGTNLAERYGIKKTSIRTDDDIDEQLDYFNDETVEVIGALNDAEDELQEEIKQDLDAAIAAGGIPMNEFLEKQRADESQQLHNLFMTPLGEKAFRQTYGIPDANSVATYIGSANEYTVPDSVFLGFYNPTDNTFRGGESPLPTGQMTAPVGQVSLLEDDEYSYLDHFNF